MRWRYGERSWVFLLRLGGRQARIGAGLTLRPMIERSLHGGSRVDTMTLASLYSLCRQAVNAWIDDYATSMGAALAYYTLFSIAPLLLIVISIAGLVFGEDAVRGEIFEQLRGLMGDEGARAIQSLLESVSAPEEGKA